MTTELSKVRFSALGGSTPVLRTEVKYEFDKRFNEFNFTAVNSSDGFIESGPIDCCPRTRLEN